MTVFARLAVVCALWLVGACAGGGGGGNLIGAGAPDFGSGGGAPPLTPASFETDEYFGIDALDVYALDLLGASTAYAAGGSGDGVTVAVIDSGVDGANPEFFGRLSPRSLDVVLNRSATEDPSGHGTFVAGLIAANRDGAGLHGLAFDSELLVIRADTPNSCASGECQYFTRDVADAIDVAISEGADVINLSLGGLPAEDATLSNALARAVDAGIVVVSAAGNDGASSPDPLALFAASPDADGLALAVGAIDENRNLAGFSNRAGDTANAFLLAPGVDVTSTQPLSACGPGSANCYGVGSGTSYSTPYVSASIALLLDAFPNISPEDAVSILLDSADDLGAPGNDPIYGAGVVNLRSAFSPIGATSASFAEGPGATGGTMTDTPPLTTNADLVQVFATPAGASGDWAWASGAFDDIIVRDGYDRAFSLTPPAPPAPRVSQARFAAAAATLHADARAAVTPFGAAYLRLDDDTPDTGLAHIRDADDGDHQFSAHIAMGRMTVMAGRGAVSTGDETRSAMALSPLSQGAWASAPFASDANWQAVRYAVQDWRAVIQTGGDDAQRVQSAALARRIGEGWVRWEVGEHAKLAGARGGATLSRLGDEAAQREQFTAVSWAGPVRENWRLGARAEWRTVSLPGGYANALERPQASAWTLSAVRQVSEGGMSFTMWQPARTETGAVRLFAPVDVSEDGAGTVYEARTARLTPSGREINFETALAWPLTSGVDLSASWMITRNPGHIAAAPTQNALWLAARRRY